jgi:collagen type VII alpha
MSQQPFNSDGGFSTVGNVTGNVNSTNEVIITTDNEHGGAGYTGFITMTSTQANVANPNKFVRTSVDGNLQVVNSDYSQTIFDLSDAGNLAIPGNLSANIIGTAGSYLYGDGSNITGIGGSVGATGATGPQGNDGATGPQGNDGATGPQGDIGATGVPGNDGATGATGLPGDPGATGLDGATGLPGVDGATGATGTPGLDGATGATGTPGFDGSTGATGATGTPGFDGSTGATGTPGQDGATGPMGDVGATGATGETGATGPIYYGIAPSDYVSQAQLGSGQTITTGGDTVIQYSSTNDPQSWWNNGSNRFQPTQPGYYNVEYSVLWNTGTGTGQINSQIHVNGNGVYIAQNQINTTQPLTQSGAVVVYLNGSTDYIEITGYTSSDSGTQQVNGGNGTRFNATLITQGGGATGATGDPGGATGATGQTGNDGATGATGVPGADGATGPQGNDGATGPQGNDGATGVPGMDGATGPQGDMGATGPQGDVGATGVNGNDGATGPQGDVGATGATGVFSGQLTQNIDGEGYSIGNVSSIATGSGSNNVVIQPNTSTAGYTLTLPVDVGSNAQVLTTDGTGTLSWSTPASSYGDANVANLLGGFGSNSISTTGTVTSAMFLAQEGSYGTTGYTFQGDGGYDTGMFSSADGLVQFYANEDLVANFSPSVWQYNLPVDMNNQSLTNASTLSTTGSAGDLTMTGGNITGVNVLTANYLSGDGSNITGLSGTAGATGATGPQGDTGATGPQGDIGATGVPGIDGATGPQGNDGATGPMGDTGATGPQGNDGNPGADGATGATGPQGDPGATGSFSGTLTQNLDASGYNITGAEEISGVTVAATNNGLGQNFKVGDDVWIGDINVADTMRVSGQENANNGYITFGNVSNTQLGRSGSGPLTWGGDYSVVGNIYSGNIVVTGNAIVGNIEGIGNISNLVNGNTTISLAPSGNITFNANDSSAEMTVTPGNVNLLGNVTVIDGGNRTSFQVVNSGLTTVYAPTTILTTQSALNLVGTASGNQQPRNFTGTMLQITAQDGQSARVSIDAFGSGAYPLIAGRAAQGNVNAPTNTQAGDVLTRLTAQGYGNTGYIGSIARLDAQARETFTDTSAGTQWVFWATPTGSTTIANVMQINSSGPVLSSGTYITFGDGSTQSSGLTQSTGTWTPTLTFDVSQGAQTYTTQVGNYVKTGKLVVLNFDIIISSNSGTGNVSISGIPFLSANQTGYQGSLQSVEYAGGTSSEIYTGTMPGNSNIVNLYVYTISASKLVVRRATNTDVDGNLSIGGTITYISAT